MALNAPSTSHNSRLQDSLKTSFLQEVFNRELNCWKPSNAPDRRKRRRRHATPQHHHKGFERTLRASSSSVSASAASTTSSCKRERSSVGARRSRTAACLRTPPSRQKSLVSSMSPTDPISALWNRPGTAPAPFAASTFSWSRSFTSTTASAFARPNHETVFAEHNAAHVRNTKRAVEPRIVCKGHFVSSIGRVTLQRDHE